VDSQVGSQIVQGVLQCTDLNCQSEYPIIDGVPIIMPRLREFIADSIFSICGRNDLSAVTESILGDCCSQGSAFDSLRQHLSCYMWDHYSDLDPAEESNKPLSSTYKSGSVVRVLEQGFALDSPFDTSTPSQVVCMLDIGCGPGRTSLRMAEHWGGMVLGVDVNFSMLKIASEMLRTHCVRYPRRRTGLVYDRREFSVDLPNMEQVDYWACDALSLPFSDCAFDRCVAMNVLDAVSSPVALLDSISKSLSARGRAILACPYDWTATVTPVESWLGGHSQRGADHGECSPMLKRLLEAEPSKLKLVAELDGIDWNIRMHDRSSMQYRVHLICAERM